MKLTKIMSDSGIFALVFAIILGFVIMSMSGCSEAEIQSSKLSTSADSFEKTRVITFINTRTDTVIFRLTGTFSCQYSNGDIDLICAVGPGKYVKHFINLNDNITYIVEDTVDVGDLYYQQIEYFPEVGGGVEDGE